MSRHVAVLMGGWSAEREVSLVSGAACAEALRDSGYRVSEIDVERNIAEVLGALAPDVVFNALHGRWGEDGRIQGLLEIMDLPYTHSGVRASAIAMHKPTAKEIFAEAGIPCVEGTVRRVEDARGAAPLPAPYVVKPVDEGSTVGVHIIRDGDNIDPLADWSHGEEVMFERFIDGLELSVAVMGERALGVIEIEPLSGFYDYEAKYTAGKARHYMPARISDEVYQAALGYALDAHVGIGCRGVSRADFRFDPEVGGVDGLFILELNTQPGMTPLSLVPEIAEHRGIGFQELVCWMVEEAGCPR